MLNLFDAVASLENTVLTDFVVALTHVLVLSLTLYARKRAILERWLGLRVLGLLSLLGRLRLVLIRLDLDLRYLVVAEGALRFASGL